MEKTMNTWLITCMVIKLNRYICFQNEREWKSYNGQTEWMYFLIEDDNLLEKYNTIWDKVNSDI